MRVLWAAGVWLLATPAWGQPADPESALQYAKNAFEYRDFEKVVEVLWPWLHPPRIGEPDRTVKARELLGISLHLVGRETAAREEFSALLLQAPDHQLDPFVVPPDVIQSFEGVRERMEPTLRAIRDREPVQPQPRATEPPQVRVDLVEVPHPAVVFLPLGLPQFVLDEPEWGILWLVLQAGGVGLNAAAFAVGDGLDAEAKGRTGWLAVQYGALGVAVLGYVASVVQGNGLLLRRRTELLERREPRASAGRPSGQSFALSGGLSF